MYSDPVTSKDNSKSDLGLFYSNFWISQGLLYHKSDLGLSYCNSWMQHNFKILDLKYIQ
jgi:hypothetical protein